MFFLCTCSLGEACENVSDINLLEDSIGDEDDKLSSINNFVYEDIEDLNLQLDEEDKEQQTELEDFRMQKEEYEEWMSIGEDIPLAATLTDLEICQAIKVGDSNGDECVEENPPTNAEMRQALDILKRGE
ncbi:hypothetical protein AVEN_213718-1 [Araneus ventricosus]|uniref:Uncharacterized protein n=1 Tax=Araneus ventricosus TaxID=182803 RepID=A0A4Y2GM34_ARAVE|nr:hypothetical protein AVEN_213718-1 [Araneus ventricosus]